MSSKYIVILVLGFMIIFLSAVLYEEHIKMKAEENRQRFMLDSIHEEKMKSLDSVFIRLDSLKKIIDRL